MQKGVLSGKSTVNEGSGGFSGLGGGGSVGFGVRVSGVGGGNWLSAMLQ